MTSDDNPYKKIFMAVGFKEEPTCYMGIIPWNDKLIYKVSAFMSRHDMLRDILVIVLPFVALGTSIAMTYALWKAVMP
jgi:hypothetical protein